MNKEGYDTYLNTGDPRLPGRSDIGENLFSFRTNMEGERNKWERRELEGDIGVKKATQKVRGGENFRE